MIDIKFIRENPEKVKEACVKKNIDNGEALVEQVLDLDIRKRSLITSLEALRAKQNKLTRSASSGQAKDDIEEAKKNKLEIKTLEPDLEETEKKFDELMQKLPNIPFDDVPVGKDDSQNKVLRTNGKIPKFDFKPKDHLELGEALNIIDVKRAAKLSGSRFGYFKREAAIMEFALVQLAFEKAVKEGFVPIVPPVLIKPEIMQGMGYIDTPEDLAERYYLEKDQLFLIGSSEQSIGGLHQGEIFEESELPNRVIAFSTCFRKEAGSYGKDTRGILRVHQFDKIELFSFCHPEKSKEEHRFLVSFEEKLWQALKIPYQVVQLSTGDMSRPSASTIDIEAWLPGQNRYREVSSASNTTNFQSRRLDIRYKSKGKPEFLHMLNATGFPIGRAIIAILENYQQKDGSVKIPTVLQKYTGFKSIKASK